MSRNGHSGNGQKHVTETPDVSHIKNIDVTHETSDVSVSALLKFVLALTLMTVVVYVLMWGLFRFFNRQAEKEPAPGPMALSKEERLPPEPRLQAAKGFRVKLENGQTVDLDLKAPEAEYLVVRDQWERQLKCESTTEGDSLTIVDTPSTGHGTPHSGASANPKRLPGCVPINEAIQKLLEQGQLSRTDGSAQDVAPPTAASSGRLTEKAQR